MKTYAKLCTLAALGLPTLAAAKQQPNVIIIFTDDQGYQDLGCYGSPNIKTPNIDAMAENGVRFTDFYVTASVSSASRAGLLTGRLNTRNGAPNVFWPNEPGMPLSEVTIAQALKQSGYTTACFGKWHLGDLPESRPTSRGFDEYLGIPYSNDMWIGGTQPLSKDITLREGYTLDSVKEFQSKSTVANKKMIIRQGNRNQVPLMKNTEVIEYPCDQATTTQRYFDAAIDFISNAKKQPFFIYITPAMPHWPLFASDDFKGKSERGLYGDVIEEIDFNVGKLLDYLKKNKLDKNTLVIFTSDNGPWIKKKEEGGSARPLRDGKFSLFEGGVRMPCVMQWSGTIPKGKTSNAIISSLDFFPTIMEMAGNKTEHDLDGKSQLELLKDPENASKSSRNVYYYVSGGNVRGVREGDWKYLIHKNVPMLFNLRDDISEKKNLAAQNPEKVAHLQELIEKAPKND
ncbi:MAG: sulfatase [Rikenellaceae bacterium]